MKAYQIRIIARVAKTIANKEGIALEEVVNGDYLILSDEDRQKVRDELNLDL